MGMIYERHNCPVPPPSEMKTSAAIWECDECGCIYQLEVEEGYSPYAATRRFWELCKDPGLERAQTRVDMYRR